MAIVTTQKACGGPLVWETSNGEKKLKRQGLCRDVIDISYDDDCEMQEKLFNGMHGDIVCDSCGKEARRLVNEREAAKQKALKDWRVCGRKSKTKEKDMMF